MKLLTCCILLLTLSACNGMIETSSLMNDDTKEEKWCADHNFNEEQFYAYYGL